MSTDTRTTAQSNGAGTGDETLTVTDNRTGRRYEIPIVDGSIRGSGWYFSSVIL